MGLLDRFRSQVLRGRARGSRARKPAIGSAPESPEEAIARLSQSMEVLKHLADLKEQVIASEIDEPADDALEPRPSAAVGAAAEPLAGRPSAGWAPIAARGHRLAATRTERAPRSTPTETPEDVTVDFRAQVGQVFSPSAPVSRRDLFAGRTQQMEDLVDTVYERGQHAVIYGERGVGKTSLAAVMGQVLDQGGLTMVRINCDGADDFTSVWRKIFIEVALTDLIPGDESGAAASDLLDELDEKAQLTPNDIRHVLQTLSAYGDLVVFIDEFDTLRDPAVNGLFADTIKTLSDQLVPSTLVILGVADDLDELIAEHASIRRALAQIHMPRMSKAELGEIVGRGLRHLGLACEASALTRIALVSQGFPYYTKLLAQSAARNAIARSMPGIALEDVDRAIERVIGRVHETIRGLYNQATHGPNEEDFQRVLRASAMARWDDRGYFAGPDVAATWKTMMGQAAARGKITNLLDQLCKTERGGAIEKKKTRGVRYRFSAPMLQPYILMEGLLSGDLTPAVLDDLVRSA